ncbi:UNVERIFIED_ORG: hypothetical protein J2806_002781 [Kosakonia oryzae]|uniref:Uncharacterized protein n=1 Tax=Kosakonia radicincitans TaxID=283686 RepID=A0AAX2ENQ3_9ENTR|nr:hypothetical protein [Kosakonia oryzae]SFE72511.1 hypothetical protein SAMN03159468_02562 [Kosakonia radicincitans]SFR03148.1 hypothetical protein SAMN03159514_01099 [Kosakonia radicincitans]SFT59153.1 hypothetical protein SAMN03159428_01245 [Kosakonia radicincitans]SFX30649.1 hypothetical protein SAMN03159436_01096 [Kosakonia radicincitans]
MFVWSDRIKIHAVAVVLTTHTHMISLKIYCREPNLHQSLFRGILKHRMKNFCADLLTAV